MRRNELPIDLNDTRPNVVHLDAYIGTLKEKSLARTLQRKLATALNELEDGKESKEIANGLVVVDYLQLMTGGGRTESREEEVAHISRTLKTAARSTKLPILALSQLNRKTESRADRRPTLADLRSSGALEQDAHIVLLIHKEENGNKNQPEVRIIIAKNRNGPTGEIPLKFDAKTTTFKS